MLKLDDHQLTTRFGSSIAWCDVVAVHAHKIDAMTHIVTMITIDHACGEFIEFTADEDGFEQVRDSLINYLPLPENWWQQVQALPDCEGITLLKLNT